MSFTVSGDEKTTAKETKKSEEKGENSVLEAE